MALFARLPAHTADALIDTWPEHRWYYRDLDWWLKRPINANINNITLNEPLLESIKEGGFINPFLATDKWYPICGSQRLRCALELSNKQRKNTVVQICRFTNPVWNPFFHWYDKDKGLECAQIYFQMAEVCFKSVYCVGSDSKGTPMLDFEEGGNQLHWDIRDGVRK